MTHLQEFYLHSTDGCGSHCIWTQVAIGLPLQFGWVLLVDFTNSGMVKFGSRLSNRSLRMFFLVGFYLGFGIQVYFVGHFSVCCGIFNVHWSSSLCSLGSIAVCTWCGLVELSPSILYMICFRCTILEHRVWTIGLLIIFV